MPRIVRGVMAITKTKKNPCLLATYIPVPGRQIINTINTKIDKFYFLKGAAPILDDSSLYNGSGLVMNNTSCFHKAFRY